MALKKFGIVGVVVLNHKEIKNDLQRIAHFKPFILFINKHNWEEIKFPSEKDGWKQLEKNNVTIALNVLYAKKMYPAYVSKRNWNHEKRSNSFIDCKQTKVT